MRREGTDRHWLHGLGLIPGVVIKKEEPLAPYTFMKVGGPAECLLDVENRAALAQALGVLDRYATPFYLLGRGSNLLVSDHGVRGAVVRLVGEFKQVEWREQEDRVDASVGAAYAVTRLVREAVARGCIGLEFAEGIPGSVGGALVMNAGAYGSEMETVVHWVEGMTRRGGLLNFARTDLAFSYRGTRLPQEVVVTRVGFRLARGKTDELRLRVRELVGRRKGSQPAGPNAGSMFRNPPGEVAGRLIEHAGLKGTRIGQAEISRRHANFIVNLGGARAADVRKLMELARRSVERMFSIRLETEVRIVGDWRDWSEEERDASRAAG